MKTPNYIHHSVLTFLGHFLKKQWQIFLIQFLLCFSWSAKESLFPFFIKNMINTVHNNHQDKNYSLEILLWQAFSLLTLWFIMELAMRLQGFLALHSFAKLRENIRFYLLDYVQGHSYEYFNTHPSGEIASKISELPRACENFVEIILLHLTSIGAAVIIGTVVLWNADTRFGWLFLLWLSLHLGINFYYTKKCNNVTLKHANSVATLNGRISDMLNNILSVLLFATTQYELQHLKTYQKKETNRFKQARWSLEKVKIYQSFLTVIYMAVMLYFLISGWFYGSMSVGDFALIPMLSFSLLGMVWWFSNQIYIIFREAGNIKASLQLVNVAHEIQDKENARKLMIKTGEIQFEQATFKYSDGQTIFNKLSLHIPAKQKIGIVGLSGSGKSTFVRLLLHLYDLNEGNILIDSQNIQGVQQDSLRAQVAVIPQELTLFNRTILDNICYGCQNATREAIKEAAQLAGCSAFIEQLPHGYQTVVGEKGVKLSGGQRQRIGIARAILKNAPILILDEATSSLDFMTEFYIQRNLDTFLLDKTVIIIAHRLSTLEKVDRIVIFEEGKIIEDNDKQIVLKKGLYVKELCTETFLE